MTDRYFRSEDERKMRFYQLPKALFNNPRYQAQEVGGRSLSLGAKACYAILQDKLYLAIRYRWMDEYGRLYLELSERHFAEILNVDEKTVRSYKRELMNYELLDEVRQGQGKPNRIYVLKPEMSTDPLNGQNARSRTEENDLEVQNGTIARSGSDISPGQDRAKLPANENNNKNLKDNNNNNGEDPAAVEQEHDVVTRILQEQGIRLGESAQDVNRRLAALSPERLVKLIRGVKQRSTSNPAGLLCSLVRDELVDDFLKSEYKARKPGGQNPPPPEYRVLPPEPLIACIHLSKEEEAEILARGRQKYHLPGLHQIGNSSPDG